jgi:uncharacterized protein (TIGR04222 family)
MPMTPEQRTLWSKIAAFEIDDPASDFRFSHRLARENGWSHEYAAEVIDEYRRFVFLAFAAGHPVTPSVDVDEAWHLHLLYTRSYWEDLCRDTLGGPLHHGPTQGGRAEADKFADWYGRTLESYQRLFDRPAPARIWPDSKARFSTASRTVHVRPATHWIVRKPHLAISKAMAGSKWKLTPATAAVFVVASLGALAVTGCVAAGGGGANGAALPNPVTSFDAKRFLIFYPLAWIVMMALTTWFQRMLLSEPIPDETVREFEHASPETVALLQEQVAQRYRLAELLTARLFAQGRIRFDAGKKRLVRADHGPKPANAFDAEMLAVVEASESAARPPQLGDYAAAIRERPLVRSAIDRLRQKDLFLESGPLRFAQGAGMAAILIWLAIGVARAQVGVARHRPIGFLIVEMILGGLVGLLWVMGPVLRSWYAPAAKILRRLKRTTAGRMTALRERFADENAGSANADDWRSVAIAGLCVLPATGLFREYRTYVQPPSSEGAGGIDAGGGGCGGGGGGCGGGGCGGCGG